MQDVARGPVTVTRKRVSSERGVRSWIVRDWEGKGGLVRGIVTLAERCDIRASIICSGKGGGFFADFALASIVEITDAVVMVLAESHTPIDISALDSGARRLIRLETMASCWRRMITGRRRL